MNSKIRFQNKNKIIELLKWFLVFTMIVIALFFNFLHYKEISSIFKITIITTCIIISIIVISITKQGNKVKKFLYESKSEIKKIFWPTYQETLQTTFIIIITTSFMSLILWGLDSIVFKLIKFIINLRL